jgi:hypothetical protein
VRWRPAYLKATIASRSGPSNGPSEKPVVKGDRPRRHRPHRSRFSAPVASGEPHPQTGASM